jgi:hypothetical protein
MNDLKPKKYPLYPTLTEEGESEAQRIMDSFKPRITAMVDELLGDLYSDVSYHVASDHWTNYRNELMNGFKGYRAGASTHQHDFKELRQAIYDNNKEEIIKDLNQDLVEEVASLKETVKLLYADLQSVGY